MCQQSFGHMLCGDQAAVRVSQDKYCPFVSAECRAQQTDELIIIIIILITYTEWGEGKINDIQVCPP